MLLELRHETEDHFLVGTVILGFLTIFSNCQPSSTFEELNSAILTGCQMDVRPLDNVICRPSSFYRVSPGDPDIYSSCDMKDEPAIKPCAGNPAFFRVRASGGPLHLKQKTQGPSHKLIPE